MKYIFIFISIFSLFTCKIEDSESINITITNSEEKQYIGSQNPMIALKSSNRDDLNFFDDSDIEENTHYQFQITGNGTNTYEVSCRLWKDEKNYIVTFCDLTGEFKVIEEFNIEDKFYFNYKTKNVTLNFKVDYLRLYRIEGKLPFLYSKSQKITVTEGQELVGLTFKVFSYNDEKIFLGVDNIGFTQFDNCRKESNNLYCEFMKKDFNISANNTNNARIGYINEFEGMTHLFLLEQ